MEGDAGKGTESQAPPMGCPSLPADDAPASVCVAVGGKGEDKEMVAAAVKLSES